MKYPKYVYAHPSREQGVPADALASGCRVIFCRFCPPSVVYSVPEPLWDPDEDGFEGADEEPFEDGPPDEVKP